MAARSTMSAWAKPVVRQVRDGSQALEITRIGELVDVEHIDAEFAGEMPDHGRPDEPGPSGDENALHREASVLNKGGSSESFGWRLSLSDRRAAPGSTGQSMPSAGSSQAIPASSAAL